MKELQDKLKRLTDQKDRKDQLQKDFEEGKITKEQLDREMADLKQEAQEMQDLDDLAEMLGQCQECLAAGNSLKAGQRIKGALDKLKAMELTDAEMNALRDRCALVAADGRYETYKLSLQFDNPQARLPHGFPLDIKQKEVQEMLFKEAGGP